MKKVRTLFIQLLCVLSVLLPVRAAAQAPPLAELVRLALEKNYDLANASLDISSEEESLKTIKESYLPRLQANGKYAYLNGDLLVDLPASTLPLLNIPIFEDHRSFNSSANLWSADLTASMLLFSGTKVPKLKAAMDHKIQGQRLMLEKDKQELIDQLSTAYDQLALLRQGFTVLKESEKRLEIEQKTADKAFEHGLITSFERSKIEIAQATLQAKQEEMNGKRSLLVSQIAQLTGLNPGRIDEIEESLDPFLISSMQEDISQRAEIAALEQAVQANESLIAAERTHWLPKVQAMASTRYLSLTNARLSTPYRSPISGEPIALSAHKIESFPTYFVGIGFQWDIFDGFKGKRTVNKAKIALQQAKNNQLKAQELLNLNLEKAKTDYAVSLKLLETGRKRKEIAEKALQIATKEYNLGLIKPSDRILAENDYQQAAMDYLQSVFNQRRAAFSYLKATGTLTIDKL